MTDTFYPVFRIGDYISPIKKSIFCEFNGVGLIDSINDHTYTVKTRKGIVYVNEQCQEMYHIVIPNKKQELL